MHPQGPAQGPSQGPSQGPAQGPARGPEPQGVGGGHARAGAAASQSSAPNTRIWVIVGVGVLVVLALVAIGYFVFGGSSSPKDTASTFLTSIQKGDASTAYDNVSVGMKGRPASEGGTGPLSDWSQTLNAVLAQSGGMTSFTIESVKEDANTATVQYRVVTGRGEETWTMNLVKEDGTWKVDLLNQRSNTYS